ncbi:calpastatin isoform X3 [Ambystoma mexicanum]|uniref:calpastatin isoform X3 n=2 Tax=Ambystoma mexicanum TaxID=8296 RepID=UPI0037E87AEF
MSKPHKGRKRSTGGGKASKEHGDKKASGATAAADKKAPDATEKQTTGPTSPTSSVSPTSTTCPGTSQTSGAQASAAVPPAKKPAAASAATSATKESTMKPSEAKGGLFSKTEPAKTTQPAKPADISTKPQKDSAVPKSPTKTSGAAAQPKQPKQPSGGKSAPSQDVKAKQTKQKEEPEVKGEKASVAAASSKPTAETKGEKVSPAAPPSKPAPEVKSVTKPVASGAAVAAVGAAGAVGAGAAAAVASKTGAKTKEDEKPLADEASSDSGLDSALDELMGTLEGPESVPESPKYTGPEITETATSMKIKKLGEDDWTIPPEYRNLLDGKDSSGKLIKPEEAPTQPPMGEEDALAALSAGFTCATSPDMKKPKLEASKVEDTKQEGGGLDSALDELMGTLDAPEPNVPETPTFTGPEVTENTVAASSQDPLGIHDGTIPPAYRHLLDGKEDGKAVPPPKPESPAPMNYDDLADALSMDFVCSPYTTVQPALPGYLEQSLGEEDLVAALSSDFTCSAPPDEKKQKLEEGAVDDSALDELMGTLEGPGENVPASPVYTGPIITEKNTATHIEELGKRESTIPPEYRKLLDGKVDGKVVPPPKPESEKPLSEAELADELSKDFACSPSPTTKPTTPAKPTESADKGTPKSAPSEEITTCAKASAVQSAPAPPKIAPAPAKPAPAPAKPAPAPAKPAPAKACDPLDALSETLGKSEPKPADTKPAVDKVKEKTGKENVEKLGEREDTIPPEYRLEELKDKDGKPILPKPGVKPKPLSDTELADAFAGDFATSTATTTQCTAPPASKGAEKSKDVPAKEVVSSCAASTVKSAAAPAPASKSPKSVDPLDALSNTLGTSDPAPKDTKPAVDKVKEKTKQEKGEKLGEREDTIHPDYRLTEVKDKDGKPMLPKPEEKSKPMTDAELLDGLTAGFVTSPLPKTSAPLPPSKKDVKKSAGGEEVISCSAASAVQAGAPAPAGSEVQIPDDAFDLLSDTLPTKEPDLEDNKPIVDKIKEKAKAEHIDKLGERDDTIPPEYRALLAGDGKGKTVNPVIPEKQKNPKDDTEAIDALSEGFCASPQTVPTNQSAKTKEQSSPVKADSQKTSKR